MKLYVLCVGNVKKDPFPSNYGKGGPVGSMTVGSVFIEYHINASKIINIDKRNNEEVDLNTRFKPYKQFSTSNLKEGRMVTRTIGHRFSWS